MVGKRAVGCGSMCAGWSLVLQTVRLKIEEAVVNNISFSCPIAEHLRSLSLNDDCRKQCSQTNL